MLVAALNKKQILLLVIVLLNIIIINGKLLIKERATANFKQPRNLLDRKLNRKAYFDHSFMEGVFERAELLSPSNFSVTNLPGLSEPIEQYSGLINVDSVNNGNLFFWFFPSTLPNNTNVPTVIFINGGPGCSSEDGALLELGPLYLVKNQTTGELEVAINPWGWNNAANLLFIDQPVGTGLSFVSNNAGICTTDLEIEQRFYSFLQSFFTIFSDYSRTQLYISGESYAGHYIPHVATYILAQNEKINQGQSNNLLIELVGIVIGNGWTHPIVQYASYATQGYSLGFIEDQQLPLYADMMTQCEEQINMGNYLSDQCANILNQLQSDSGNNITGMVNAYDFTLFDPTGGNAWPMPGETYNSEYLSNPLVKEALHATATPQNWTECNNTVYEYLTNQDESSLYLLIEALAQLKVLLYNGNYDIICNHIGTTDYLDGMVWTGQTEWASAERYIWSAPDIANDATVTAGYSKSSQNLTYVEILDASHMVPMNQPSYAFEMIRRFINNEKFQDYSQATAPYVSPLTPSPTSTTNHKSNNTNTPNSNNKSLPTGAWVGIVIGGAVLGIVIGVFATIFIVKQKGNQYTLLSK